MAIKKTNKKTRNKLSKKVNKKTSKKNTIKTSNITNKKINSLINKINEYSDNNLLEDIVYKFLDESNTEDIDIKNTKEKIAQSLIALALDGDIKAIKEILSLEKKASAKKKENKEYLINIEFTSVSSDNDKTGGEENNN